MCHEDMGPGKGRIFVVISEPSGMAERCKFSDFGYQSANLPVIVKFWKVFRKNYLIAIHGRLAVYDQIAV